MAKVSGKNSTNSFLMTLSLSAVFMLSLYFLNEKGIFNLGSRAARGEKVETGMLVLATQSTCNQGSHALVKESGNCVSAVASNVEFLLNQQVRAKGMNRNGVFYISEIYALGSENANPEVSMGPSQRPNPTVRPSSPPVIRPTLRPINERTPDIGFPPAPVE